VNVVDEWQDTFASLQDWINLYIEKAKATPEILTDCEQIMEKASEVGKNASSEYGDLDLMAKAKMVQANVKAVNNCKNTLK
jgi:hypothetical protein